jgi:hypothetical protein
MRNHNDDNDDWNKKKIAATKSDISQNKSNNEMVKW